MMSIAILVVIAEPSNNLQHQLASLWFLVGNMAEGRGGWGEGQSTQALGWSVWAYVIQGS